VIKDLANLLLADGLELIYEGIAAGVSLGAVVGLAAVWLSIASRGTDSS
jgi:hypothetical protein